MNWDRLEGEWKQRRGKAVRHWGTMMNDELAAIAGKYEELVGQLQERYGIANEKAKVQIDDFKAIVEQPKKIQRKAQESAGTIQNKETNTQPTSIKEAFSHSSSITRKQKVGEVYSRPTQRLNGNGQPQGSTMRPPEPTLHHALSPVANDAVINKCIHAINAADAWMGGIGCVVSETRRRNGAGTTDSTPTSPHVAKLEVPGESPVEE